MFNLGFFEILVIVVLALIFIGPDQMPELARNIGKIFRDLKRATNEVTDSLQREVSKMQDEKSHLAREIKESIDLDFKAEENSISRVKLPAPEASTELTKNDDEKSNPS